MNIGIDSQYIDATEIDTYTNISDEKITQEIIKKRKKKKLNNAITLRRHNIKKIIPNILTQVTRIMNNYYADYKPKEADEKITEYDIFIMKEKKIYDKYYDRFKKAKVIVKNDIDKFLHGWKKVTEHSFDNLHNQEYIYLHDTFITSEDILNNDKYGNYLLSFLVNKI